ncbi:MAG: ketoacyl-ACP synthase III [Thermoguttaceae bacterium]|nr:ketoacyl-ACP synthase III [Thermoguttaceae bacterium]
MKIAQIKSVAAYLPEGRLGNKELVEAFPMWTEDKIRRKLGIAERPLAVPGETASDMGFHAAERLFSSGLARREDIDFLVFCTQSPDYFLPTSACVLQHRLGLRKDCGAFDINLGCSGYVYGLGVCKGLLTAGLARKVLFICAETYSRYINPQDRVTRPLFGDGAAATLLEVADAPEDDVFAGAPTLGPFEFGTDGAGAGMLMVPAGASRKPSTPETAVPTADAFGAYRSQNQLYMNGQAIFTFSIDVVPPLVKRVVGMAAARGAEIDAYIFHQANKFMLDRLRELCEIDERRYFNNIATRGNTVSASIPIAMIDAVRDGVLKPGNLALLVGFGVGLSWGATFVRLPEDFQVVPLP